MSADVKRKGGRGDPDGSPLLCIVKWKNLLNVSYN